MHKFGIWASQAQKVSLKWREQTVPLNAPNKRGWWTLEVPEAGCGDRYAFLLDADPTPYPDPRGLRQPDGVHGPSELYDHTLFTWHDQLWRGSPKMGSVIYELHIGTLANKARLTEPSNICNTWLTWE
jgi:maltooligosyltrehalose trehalohydrolase